MDYITEIYRVMKPGAAAILYLGFLPVKFWRQHVDLSTNSVSTAREVTLRLTMPLARALFSTAGFQVVEARRLRKRPWKAEWGGQYYAIIRKDNS